jgi:signal transduction histidine kinase
MTSFSKAIAAGALLIVACIGALSFWSEVRNEHDRQWVMHTLVVVEKLQAVGIDITQVETGERGYMFSGHDRYLGLYGAGVEKVDQDLKELSELTADNPAEQAAIRQLTPLIAERLAELHEGIKARSHSGLPVGVEAVAHANDGEMWMGLIASQIAEMHRTEATLLSRRLETVASSTRKMKVIIAFGNSLAVLILLVKGFVIYKEIGRRNLAEQNLAQVNRMLEQKTVELSETNVEVESFAYSVAHDLRAPLRHIAGYSNVLIEDYGPCVDAVGQRHLKKIADGAQKMGHLVDDLLSLSKVGRQELSLEDTPLGPLLGEVVEELSPEYAGREIDWQIAALSNAECDPGLIKQVFINLVSNAVKYSRRREQAVIQVGETMQNGERVIFVKDNGAGFDMQHSGKLFGVFQRLHKTGDFEGTGVGLAIVQRIIRKHGGRIWAEAEIDRGATFFFTLGLPKRDPNRSAPVAAAQAITNDEVVHV